MMRKARSNGYQYYFNEIPTDGVFFLLDKSLQDFGVINYSEEFKELNDEIIEFIFDLAESVLTERQLEIFNMLKNGHTQIEIADKYGICQSSVQKSIFGNCLHHKGYVNQGGINKKFINELLKSQEFKELLRKLRELEDD